MTEVVALMTSPSYAETGAPDEGARQISSAASTARLELVAQLAGLVRLLMVH